MVCKKLKPNPNKNSRNSTAINGRSSLKPKRTDRPVAARPASDCEAKNHAAEVKKSAICRGRSERVDGVESNAFNDICSMCCATAKRWSRTARYCGTCDSAGRATHPPAVRAQPQNDAEV